MKKLLAIIALGLTMSLPVHAEVGLSNDEYRALVKKFMPECAPHAEMTATWQSTRRGGVDMAVMLDSLDKAIAKKSADMDMDMDEDSTKRMRDRIAGQIKFVYLNFDDDATPADVYKGTMKKCVGAKVDAYVREAELLQEAQARRNAAMLNGTEPQGGE